MDIYARREFTLYIADDPWESGEILLPSTRTRLRIWDHFQSLHPIPDITQFQVVAGRQEITKQDKWPTGKIEAVPVTFPVMWRIETPQDAQGFIEAVQEKMSPLITATEAWGRLHSIVPGLYEDANLDFRGKLRPALTINAEIIREEVRVAVEFEVIKKWSIKYIHENIPNTATWEEIHRHFSSIDERIPAFEYHVNEEIRPYQNGTLLTFKLVKGTEIPDTTRGFGRGAAGGVSKGGYLLPPIVFPKTVDVSKGKVSGGRTGPVKVSTDSSSDSMEDEEDDDTHKLHKLS